MGPKFRYYSNLIKQNPEKFLGLERKNFPEEYSDADKVYSEYVRMQAFYHDKIINETYYDSNQMSVIESTLSNIEQEIAEKNFNSAKYYIVILQTLMDMEIKFNTNMYNIIKENIPLEIFVNVDKFFLKKTYSNNDINNDNFNKKRK